MPTMLGGVFLILIWTGCNRKVPGYFGIKQKTQSNIKEYIYNSNNGVYGIDQVICYKNLSKYKKYISDIYNTTSNTMLDVVDVDCKKKCKNYITNKCIKHTYTITKKIDVIRFINLDIVGKYYDNDITHISFIIKSGIAKKLISTMQPINSGYVEHKTDCDGAVDIDAAKDKITAAYQNHQWYSCVDKQNSNIKTLDKTYVIPVGIMRRYVVYWDKQMDEYRVGLITTISVCYNPSYIESIIKSKNDLFYMRYSNFMVNCSDGLCVQTCNICHNVFNRAGLKLLAVPTYVDGLKQSLTKSPIYIEFINNNYRLLLKNAKIQTPIDKNSLSRLLPFNWHGISTLTPHITKPIEQSTIQDDIKLKILMSAIPIITTTIIGFIIYCLRGKCCLILKKLYVLPCCCCCKNVDKNVDQKNKTINESKKNNLDLSHNTQADRLRELAALINKSTNIKNNTAISNYNRYRSYSAENFEDECRNEMVQYNSYGSICDCGQCNGISFDSRASIFGDKPTNEERCGISQQYKKISIPDISMSLDDFNEYSEPSGAVKKKFDKNVEFDTASLGQKFDSRLRRAKSCDSSISNKLNSFSGFDIIRQSEIDLAMTSINHHAMPNKIPNALSPPKRGETIKELQKRSSNNFSHIINRRGANQLGTTNEANNVNAGGSVYDRSLFLKSMGGGGTLSTDGVNKRTSPSNAPDKYKTFSPRHPSSVSRLSTKTDRPPMSSLSTKKDKPPMSSLPTKKDKQPKSILSTKKDISVVDYQTIKFTDHYSSNKHHDDNGIDFTIDVDWISDEVTRQNTNKNKTMGGNY